MTLLISPNTNYDVRALAALFDAHVNKNDPSSLAKNVSAVKNSSQHLVSPSAEKLKGNYPTSVQSPALGRAIASINDNCKYSLHEIESRVKNSYLFYFPPEGKTLNPQGTLYRGIPETDYTDYSSLTSKSIPSPTVVSAQTLDDTRRNTSSNGSVDTNALSERILAGLELRQQQKTTLSLNKPLVTVDTANAEVTIAENNCALKMNFLSQELPPNSKSAFMAISSKQDQKVPTETALLPTSHSSVEKQGVVDGQLARWDSRESGIGSDQEFEQMDVEESSTTPLEAVNTKVQLPETQTLQQDAQTMTQEHLAIFEVQANDKVKSTDDEANRLAIKLQKNNALIKTLADDIRQSEGMIRSLSRISEKNNELLKSLRDSNSRTDTEVGLLFDTLQKQQLLTKMLVDTLKTGDVIVKNDNAMNLETKLQDRTATGGKWVFWPDANATESVV